MSEAALSTDDFATLLSQANQPEQPQKDSSPAEQQEAQVETEPAAEAESAPEQEAPEAEVAEEPDGQPQGPTDEAVVKWETAAGETFEVPVSELKNGYMRDADYRQKTQAVAEERKAAFQQLQQHAQQIEALAPELGALNGLQQQLQQYQNLDWNAIRAADPQQHSALLADYLLLKDRVGDAQQRVAARREQINATHVQSFQQATKEAADHLRRVIPNFGDATIRQMNEFGKKSGFTDAELSAVADKRMLETLWKASQWDALQAKKPAVENKVKALPPKTAPSTAAPPRNQKQEQITKALQSKRALSTNDFAALLKATRTK
jgi:hypothetical protein